MFGELSIKSSVAAACVLFALSAKAQYKCVQSGGAVTFQQTPCSTADSGHKLDMRARGVEAPSDDRPVEIRAAIAARRPAVGMTAAELVRAIGRPNRINAAEHGSNLQDQLVYYRDDRTLYVHTRDGIVTSIQDTAGAAVTEAAPSRLTAPAQRTCASPREIRNIEIEISKIQNRGNDRLQVELHRRLADARACR